MSDHITLQQLLTSSIVAILLASFFIWLAARFVLRRSSIIASILSAVVSTLLAGLLLQFVGTGFLGYALALAVWALVTSLFFFTSWLRGALIGVVAWVLWLVTNLIIGALS